MKRKPMVWTISAIVMLAAAFLLLTNCSLARPFHGPGLKPIMDTPGGPDSTVVVAITNAVVDGDNRKAFDDHTQKVIASLESHDGFIGYSVRTRILGNEVWTMTVWRDKAAMRAFVRGQVHDKAIEAGYDAVLQERFLVFEAKAKEIPLSWGDVLKRLEEVPLEDSAAKRAKS